MDGGGGPDQPGGGVDQGLVEPRGDHSRGDAGEQLAHHGPHQGAVVELPHVPLEVEGERVGPVVAREGRVVPRHRDLALVQRGPAPEHQRPHAIEQAADAVDARGVDAAREHLARNAQVVRRLPLEQQKLREGWGAVERVVEQGERDLPHVVDRGVAAGQGDRPERGEPGDLVRVREQQLPAP